MPEPVFEKWTDEQCMLLEPTWQLCRVRRDAHHMAYRFYYKYNTIVSLPPILIGAILSTISFNPDAVPSGVSAALAMFITGMATVNSFFGLSKSQEGHRQSYRAFNMLVREIELNIIRGREEPKRSFIDFLEYCNEQFTKVTEDAPTLNPAARQHLDSYRGSRPSPFDKLVSGDKNASGFNPELVEGSDDKQGQTVAEQEATNKLMQLAQVMTAAGASGGDSNASTENVVSQISGQQLPLNHIALLQQTGQLNDHVIDIPSQQQQQQARRQFTALRQTFEQPPAPSMDGSQM